MQYIIAAYHFNKSFMYLLMAHNNFLSNKATPAQYFVFHRYAEIVFQGIIPDTGTAEVSTAEKR